MGNVIYDLKIVNEKIREDLKRELPSFSFSVKKDSRSIYITILSGNIKPFKAFSEAEKDGYIGHSINQYWIDDESSLSDAGKELIKQVKEITDKYNYDNSDLQSDYFDVNFYLKMYIGTREKPYVYKRGGKPSSRPTRPTDSSSNDELIYTFNGWKMYKRHIGEKIVFIVSKNKETPSNKESWNQIKSEIYTQTGFQWNPSYQVFRKWEKLPDGVFAKLETIFNTYYPAQLQTMPENPAATTEQVPQVEIGQSTATPTDPLIKNLLKTFSEPQLVNDKNLRKYIINKLLERVEALYEEGRSAANYETFLKKYAEQIFAPIVADDNRTYNVSDGIKFDFSTKAAKRQTKKDLLLRIMDLAGCAIGLDVVFGVFVDVEGEANSNDNKKYANIQAQKEGREVYIEEIHVGGTLSYLDWYSLNSTLEIAKNFLDNVFEASFKYPDLTEKFKKSLQNDGDVELKDKDYLGKDIISEAVLYSYRTTNSFVYILQQGGYVGLYSNSFNLGYAMMQKLIKQDSGLVTYVKDVSPFSNSLVGAREFLPQLQEKFPDLFGAQDKPTTDAEDRALLQSRIDELENFLKLAGDMDDEDKRVILSEILDLHTLLKLI